MGKSRTLAVIAGAVMGLLAALSSSAGPGVDLAAAAQAPVRSVGVPVQAARSAVVNMAALAKQAAAQPARTGPAGTRVIPAPAPPPDRGTSSPPFLLRLLPPAAGLAPQIASPSPAQDFAGLDDIASPLGYEFIPPDTDGAVGLAKVMSGLNNNYRIWDKSTGAVVSTVGTEAFWTAVSGTDLFDPKTLYDPINDRWIVVMMSGYFESFINIGVSQTSDPSGSYTLYSFNADQSAATWADFPTIGFNKDYIAVNVNMYDNKLGSYVNSKVLVVDYPALRAGTRTSWFLTGSDYCSSPAATYSPTESTLYVPTQSYDSPGSYRVDTITKGAGGVPVYAVGATKSRGLTWTPVDGNALPQAPGTGGGTPVRIEAQDDMIRSTPVVRDGSIYYTQTIGLPAGAPTRTSILWTKLTAGTGDVAGGGLIDDPTATATNGGKWYAYPHIAVNKYGDAIVGFSQFSSAQWASAGYSVHVASDPAGTMRDPVVYKAGEDVYQKDYGSGRYRWGDYSKAQVDPSNDADLWVVNEYAKPIGSNTYGGVWGTWWAKVASPTTPPAIVTSFTPTSGPVGTSVTITGSGFTGATAVHFNGTAATYSAVSDVQITATVPAGATTGPIAVDAPGGTGTSADSFSVTPTPIPTPTPGGPPTTRVSGLPSRWVSHAVTLRFTATPAAGAPVAYTEYRIGDGAWTKGTALTVKRQGATTVGYRSVDTLGAVEATQSCTVRIDETPPTVSDIGRVRAWRGARARFAYRLGDRFSTHATAVLGITRYGRPIIKFALGRKVVGRRLFASLRCTLPVGTWSWRVVARDEAGNRGVGAWHHLDVYPGVHERR